MTPQHHLELRTKCFRDNRDHSVNSPGLLADPKYGNPGTKVNSRHLLSFIGEVGGCHAEEGYWTYRIGSIIRGKRDFSGNKMAEDSLWTPLGT